MGRGLVPTGNEVANPCEVSSFAAAGQSAPVELYGSFNVSLWGAWVGSVQLERSFDGGTTWLPVAANATGTILIWTQNVSLSWTEPEQGVAYRLNCTAYTSGPIDYRISGSSDFVMTGGVGR